MSTKSSKMPNSSEVKKLMRQLCSILHFDQSQKKKKAWHNGTTKRSIQHWAISLAIAFLTPSMDTIESLD